MSEQVIRPVSSGNVATQSAAAVSGDTAATPVATPVAEAGKKLPEPEKPALDQFVAQLNMLNRSIGRDLRFQVDLESGSSVIQVLDRDTGEIIRQIPPEELGPQISANSLLDVRLYDAVV